MTESGDGRRLAALLEAAAPEPPTTVELADVARRVQRRRRRVWLAPLAAALVVVAVAAGVVALAHGRGRSHGHTPATTSPFVTKKLKEGLTVTFPSRWRYVAPAQGTGPGQLGWLTNQPTVAQCHDDRTGPGQCNPPVTTLRPGGVLVSLFAGDARLGEGGNAIDPTGTVDGFPAMVTTDFSTVSDCPQLTDDARIATILVSGTGQPKEFDLTACFADQHQPSDQASFARMLTTARITGTVPTPVATVGIRLSGTPLANRRLSGLTDGTISLQAADGSGIFGEVRAGSRVLVFAPAGTYRLSATAGTARCPSRTVQVGPGHPHRITVICDGSGVGI